MTREPAIAKQCSMSPRATQDDDLFYSQNIMVIPKNIDITNLLYSFLELNFFQRNPTFLTKNKTYFQDYWNYMIEFSKLFSDN